MSVCVDINVDDDLPIFGLIKHICVSPDMRPFLICKLYITDGFDEHYQSYNVHFTEKMVQVDMKNLPRMRPTFCFAHKNGGLYIV